MNNNINSQAAQDLFVLYATKHKKNGYFVEIGSNHPVTHNNTFILENVYNWKGLMVEYDKSFEESYKLQRPNSIYEMKDARNVSYREILDNNMFPVNIDYLQIDLDVDNRSTLDTLLLLNNTVFDKYKFATITFEHDIYTGNYYNTRSISRQLFKDKGYVLVFPDVSAFFNNRWVQFEDWYVHPELVDMDNIKKIMTSASLNSDQIKQLFKN